MKLNVSVSIELSPVTDMTGDESRLDERLTGRVACLSDE